MKTHRLKFIVIALFCIYLVKPSYSQSPASDPSFHLYRINYWVTGTICGAGAVANYLGISHLRRKHELSLLEIQALNRSQINSFDSWAFKQDASKRGAFEKYSDYTLMSSIALPVSLMLDKQIRRDWLGILLMYLETMTITTNIYEWSFLGPNFQNKMRPVAYYDQLSYEERKLANNRNSFYSGHVASVE